MREDIFGAVHYNANSWLMYVHKSVLKRNSVSHVVFNIKFIVTQDTFLLGLYVV